jgi:hypothetical protein
MLCECGCGNQTTIHRGTPRRFISGHNANTAAWKTGYAAARQKPLAERFWRKVDKNGPVIRPELGPCWIFTGSKTSDGYGQITLCGRGSKTVYAHRLAWELTHGPIPAGALMRHACDNPPCCRPDHVQPGSSSENVRDAFARGRMARGANHPHAKLNDEQEQEIRSRYTAGGATQEQLAREFGVSRATVVRRLARREACA